MNELPFIEERNNDFRIRLFSENVDPEELKWHRDHEDRIVEIYSETNWLLQMDNELPKKLIVGEKYEIPKGIYHRLIKGVGDLKIKIKTNGFG